MEKNIAAFFDIDGTLYREALSVELFKKLSKNAIIPEYRWLEEIRPIYNNWVTRIGEYNAYMDVLSKVYTESIIGLNKNVLSFLAKQVIEDHGERLFKYTKSRIQFHREAGHKIIFISGTPSELAQYLAAKLDVTDYIASVYMTDDNNNYTGEILPMWKNENKKHALSSFVEKYNVDLSESYAYGDTGADVDMLSSVGHPTAVNPTRDLIEGVRMCEELKKKIQIIIERKDVIYNLDINCIDLLDV